jgi:hypothetical protein
VKKILASLFAVLVLASLLIITIQAENMALSPTSTDHCTPLPPPTGPTVTVSSVTELQNAVNSAAPGDTILVADGVYDLNGVYLRFDVPNVTLRSVSGNRESVILDGNYVTTEIVQIVASNVTIADLTLREAYYHPIHVMSSSSADTTGTFIYNVHIVDPGEQAVKINPYTGENALYFPDNGIIACSHIELTDAGRPHIRNNCYTGGVDAHQARDWIIRDNLIEGFWCDSGLSEHGIHLWRSCRDTLVERNELRDNGRGIGFGLATSGDGIRTYPDDPCPGAGGGYVDHYGGIIRNNFVFASDGGLFASDYGFDCGICLWQACGAQVLHNTVVSTQAPFSSIEWRFDYTDVDIINNLVSHNLMDRGGAASRDGNLEAQPLSLFVDGANGDLHLAESADAAIDHGVLLSVGLCDDDFDGDARPIGPAPDVGADEYGVPSVTATPTPTPTPTNPPCDLEGDLDGDGDVDIADIMLVAARWHTAVGDDNYEPDYDLDDSGVIDIVDIMLVAIHWGETCTTPTTTPTVTATPTPTPTPTSTTVVPSGLIQPTDLVYQGAFAYPAGDDWAYSGHALAYYSEGDPESADGYPGSLYAAAHAWYDLVGEITIPEPVIADDFDDLPQASVLRALTDITEGWKDNCTYNDDCIYREVDGLGYLPNINKIVWNLRDWYNVAGYDQDSLGWSELDMTGAQGVWHIGERGNNVFHNAKTCDYLFKAPESFASQYLEGKWLIAGNHRGAGAFGGSQGPTLYALAPWEDGNPPESGQNLDALALLYYPEIYPECLDDPDECTFPNYRAKDDWGGGAWVQTADRSGILIFGRKGLGDNCYGTPEECGGDACDPYKGYHAYPYEPQILFYDPGELEQVIAGTRQPWEVVPYEVYRPLNEVIDQECATLGAAAYDQERRLIYVTEQTAGPWGETVVHVWEVGGGT